jgi:hypothetical protein
MEHTEQIPQGGTKRHVHYFVEMVRAGSLGLWRTVPLRWGIGLVALYGTVLSGGAVLAAVLNAAWLIAGAFALVLLIAGVGGFRVWSRTEHALARASVRVKELQDLSRGPTAISIEGGSRGNTFENVAVARPGMPAPRKTSRGRPGYRLIDLLTPGQGFLIRDVTFDQPVQLYGPVMVTFQHCAFGVLTTDGSESGFLEVPAGRTLFGVILLERCTFVDVELVNVTIVDTGHKLEPLLRANRHARGGLTNRGSERA